MPEKKMVDIYDPAVDAFRQVSLEIAITNIKEAKKLEKYLLANGIITPEETKVD